MWNALISKVRQLWQRPLSPAESAILHALGRSWTLKSHRYLDGTKLYRLHPLEGEPQEVDYAAVQSLIHKKLVTTNQKFPAATFLLTRKGQAVLGQQAEPLQGVAKIVKFDS